MKKPAYHFIYCLIIFKWLVSAGMGATLSIKGISTELKKDIMPKLEPRLEFISKREPSAWRADDASFFLKRLMIRSGYPEVQIEWSLPGSNTIELNVTPGPRYLFGSVTSTNNNDLDSKKLREYFLHPLVETEAVSAKKAPYIKDYSERGALNVNNYLKSLGYWNSKVSIKKEQLDEVNKTINISLNITKGKLLPISQPKFIGANSKNAAILNSKTQLLLGKISTTENINKLRNIVVDHYRENGYQLATVTMQVKHSANSSTLTLKISEGAQYKVNEIIVDGQDKTKKRKISRYYRKEKGNNYDENAVNDVTATLISTGAFSSVRVKPVITDGAGSELVNLHVTVEEAKARSFRSYAGFGSFEGFIIGSGYNNRNYHGSLRNFYLGGEFSNRGFLGEIGITEPRFANSPVELNVRSFLIERDYEGYGVQKAGIETSFAWAPDRHYRSKLYTNATFASSDTVSLTDDELGPDDYLVVRLGVEQDFDFRDNALLPTKGFHGRALLESGIIGGNADNSFFRAELESSYRIALSPSDHISTRMLIAGIQTKDSGDLPIDVRLFSGGVNAQRAYDERELGPRSLSGDPLGGESYWVASAEYIRTISDPIKLTGFVDAGQLYSDFDDFNVNDPSIAAGIGVRIDLPIGPIRLEYGRNLNKKDGEPSGTFHFSIGANF